MSTRETCTTCHGTGEEHDAGRRDGRDLIRCRACRGVGTVTAPAKIGHRIEIPADEAATWPDGFHHVPIVLGPSGPTLDEPETAAVLRDLESARRWAVHHETTAAHLATRLLSTIDVLVAVAEMIHGTPRKILKGEADRIARTLEEAAGV